MAIARDKFWMFGVRPHQDDVYLGKSTVPLISPRSRITPAEGALMLDLPNMLMINCDGTPVPFSQEAYGYAESFVRMNKVLWGATGSGGFRVGNEEAFICKLAEKYPNIGGAFLDDLFHRFRGDPDSDSKMKAVLHEIRCGLDKACRPMELYIVWYTSEIDSLSSDAVADVDGITLWTFNCKELPLLEARFDGFREKFPDKKLMLGIYMYDFPSGSPLSDEQMEKQCEFGLRLLKEGQIHGMIFEANSVMGVGLPSERWLRNWIDQNKYTEIPD